MTQTIDVADKFSKYPAGRYKKDGNKTGEHFREDFLKPALSKGKVIVELDGALGYGSSFLEEAFGGLIRQGLSLQKLKEDLQLSTKNENLSKEIWMYIDQAAAAKRKK